jgi:CubicO group peptidase (beta-lactamase class C family)
VRSRRISSTIVVVACVALLGGCAAPIVAAAPGEPIPLFVQDKRDDKRDNFSDAALERLVDSQRPGCSAAVAVDGVVLWAGARGLADLGTAAPLTTDTRFNMASVSKQFTATAILMLEREGLVSLDDVISTYVDGLPAWGQTTTLDQLLHHTSHIRDFWKRLQGDGIGFGDYVSHEDIVLAIARMRTLEPGSGYLYSNANYVLLAEVVRRVTGDTLPVFLEDRVFGPLDLDMEVSPNLKAPDVAVSYDDNDHRQDSGWSAYGYSEIFSTPTELARWADQYRAGTIVSARFATDAVDMPDGARYAAGIEIRADDSLRHDGRLGGHITTFQISPDRETALVVMCNGHTAPRFPVAEALREIWFD